MNNYNSLNNKTMATKVNKFLKWLEQTGLSNLGLIIAALMCFFIGYLP